MRFELAKSLFHHIEIQGNRKKINFSLKENRTLSRRSCNYMVSHAVPFLLPSISFIYLFVYFFCDPETVSLILLLKICSDYSSCSPILLSTCHK